MWTDVKAKLASFDRKGLLGLIQDLYAAHKDNQMFLHARFGLGEDALSPYKETIAQWLWPDSFLEPGYVCPQSQESHCRLQEGDGGCRRIGRVDGFLLRASGRFFDRSRLSRRELLRCPGCECSTKLLRLRTGCRSAVATL